MRNICKEIQCPHVCSEGCNLYAIACHCPIHRQPGVIKETQYFLYTEGSESYDLNIVLATEESQSKMQAYARFGNPDKSIPAGKS